MRLEDGPSMSEINILPDGRVCLFGASQQVLEILDAVAMGDPALRRRLECLRAASASQGVASQEIRTARDEGT